MTLPSLLDWIDIALLTVIVITAYDALRQTHPSTQPVRSITFALISIGGFGWIAYDVKHGVMPWWVLVFHTGIAMHSVIRFVARNHLEERYVGFHQHDRRMAATSLRRKAKQ